MADSQSQSETQPSRSRLSHLRAIAQSHLSQIESEKAQEEAQLTQAEAEIQRYSKMSSFDRKRLAGSNTIKSQSQSQSESNKQQQPPISILQQDPSTMDITQQKRRFRPFPEILHRLRWDPTLEISEYIVGYLERFEGIKEMPASSWIRDFSDEEWIPMHRVRYVKRVDGKTNGGPELGVVWDRDGRVDLFAAGVGEELDRERADDLMSLDGTSVTGGVAV